MSIITSRSTPLLDALKQIKPEDRNRNGRQGLMLVQHLLREGNDPNEADDTGLTPLMFLATDADAVKAINSQRSTGENHLSALRSLVEFKVDTMANGGAFYKVAPEACIKEVFIRSLQINTLTVDALLAGAEHLSLNSLRHTMPGLLNTAPKLLTQARQEDGATFAHVIWRNHGVDVLSKFLNNPLGEMSDVSSVWTFVNYAVVIGLDVHAKDDHGQSCVDLMLELRDKGFPGPLMMTGYGYEILMGVITSHDQAKRLAKDTAEVNNTSARARM